MTRGLSGAQTTAVEAQDGSPYVHLLEFLFGNGTTDAIRYTTGPFDLAWNSLTWLTAGGALGFESIEETTDDRGQGVELVLSGVNPAIIAVLLTTNYRGRFVNIWRAYLNRTTGLIVDVPISFGGYLMNGQWEIEEQSSPEGVTSVECRARVVSRLAMFRQRRGIVSNLTSHQRIAPGDTFWQHVASLVNRPIYWGIPSKIFGKEPGRGSAEG